MASQENVKRYLACWFQLGKKLILDRGQEVTFTGSVVNGDRYSPEFEACWQEIMAHEGKNYYVEGTEHTLDVLLSPAWEIFSCSRCNMPVPKRELGVQDPSCPCVDLPSWPNLELPIPRAPIANKPHMQSIKSRLLSKSTIDK